MRPLRALTLLWLIGALGTTASRAGEPAAGVGRVTSSAASGAGVLLSTAVTIFERSIAGARTIGGVRPEPSTSTNG